MHQNLGTIPTHDHRTRNKKIEREGKKLKQKRMHQPGIEPGSVPWQGTILPLDHWCFNETKVFLK